MVLLVWLDIPRSHFHIKTLRHC